ncbi:FAD-dependent oxidoreductase [Roseobacteraceae bacterium S113]
MQNKTPKRVAIIGGGCAAVTTALELTRPERNGEFDVTIYQLGWRLGGKGASGRDAETGRIEEHGLHLWMGFYENAFRMMRDCYAELDRPEGHPLRTWQDAFVPDNFVGVTEAKPGNQWQNWSAYFPPAAGLPGDPLSERTPFSVRGYLTQCLRLVRTLLLSVQDKGDIPPVGDGQESLTAAATSLITSLIATVSTDVAGSAARAARYGQLAFGALILEAMGAMQSIVEKITPGSDLMGPAKLLDRLSAAIQKQFDLLISTDDELRRVWEIVDTLLAIARGMLREGVLFSPRGFDLLDKYDWREWLETHGARQGTLDSAFIRGSYDLLFAFENGDVERPQLAAGQALRGAMRMFFTYRGALFWKMQAGMGDVVFAPPYEVLKRRGVKFEFFHRLENIGLSSDTTHVQTLDFKIEAKVKGGKEYAPLVDFKGLECWPSLPNYDQLVGGAKLKKARWNPEHDYHGPSAGVGTKQLKVGDDFDFAVLAVGFGAVEGLCSELIAAEPAWKRMVEEVKTVATQAFQIWMDESVEELGWRLPPINISGFVEPFDTWADMRQLIKLEDWEKDPKAIAYFCSVLPDSEINEHAYTSVRRNVIDFLNRDIQHFWPKAVADGSFRWDILSGSDDATESAIDSQFWTANTAGTERYVLSLPGTLDHRISPLDDRFDNFTIAGDWTGCGHQAGCVEAAVMSGLLAASALSGTPDLAHIIGYDHP